MASSVRTGICMVPKTPVWLEGGDVSYLCEELPRNPNGEVIDACSRVRLKRGHKRRVLCPFPPEKVECMYVGIFLVSACPAPLEVAS